VEESQERRACESWEERDGSRPSSWDEDPPKMRARAAMLHFDYVKNWLW
jgi:hypothetical protein